MMSPALARCLAAGLLSVPAVACAQASDPPTATGPATSFAYIGEVFANPFGGRDHGAVYTGIAELVVDAAGEGWSAHANAYAPHGHSLTERHVGDFAVLSNIDAEHQVRLQELWWQKDMGSLALRLGMLSSDTEYWGTDYGELFISSAFGAPNAVTANLPNSPIFPTAALGARLALDLGGERTLRVTLQDGDCGDPRGDNRHGLDVRFGQGTLALLEYQAVAHHEGGMTDNLRLGAFVHSGDFEDDRGGTSRRLLGAIAVVDRALSDRVGWFARAGVAQGDRSTVPFSIESGVTVKDLGASPGTLGLAVAWIDLDRDLGRLAGVAGRRHELIAEATWQWPLNERISLQPDLQYIVDPGGTGAARDALVAGLRLTLSWASR